MGTLVLSDLHLGGRGWASVLASPGALGSLVERLREVDRLVLLGDILELRAGPSDGVLRRADPILRAIAAAVHGEIVVVPGNHDHRLAAEILARRTLGVEQVAAPRPGGIAAALCERLGNRTVLAYPGLWLGSGVYATHGHYQDLHSTVATVETIAARALSRLLGPVPGAGASPLDYERALRPIYAFNRARALLGGVPVVAARPEARRPVTPAAPSPTRAARSRAHALAMAEVLRRLEIRADHVVFGHTHVAGVERTSDASPVLLNCGSWVGARRRAGHAVFLDQSEAPRLIEIPVAGALGATRAGP